MLLFVAVSEEGFPLSNGLEADREKSFAWSGIASRERGGARSAESAQRECREPCRCNKRYRQVGTIVLLVEDRAK